MKTKPFGKKAQITIFIILGIIILFSSAAFFYIKDKLHNNSLNLESPKVMKENIGFNNIEKYIEYKIQKRFEDAIYLSAINGGRIYDENYCYLTEDYKLSYYRYNSIMTYPNLTLISDDILRYVFENVMVDLAYDEELEKRGIVLNFSTSPQGNVIFNQKESIADISWKITASGTDSSVRTMDKFLIKSDLRFLHLYDFAKEVSSYKNLLPLEYDSIKNDSLSLNVFPYDEEKIFYTIKDSSVEPSLIFMFATNDVPDSYPKFEPIPNFNLKVNETLSYDLYAEDIDGNEVFYDSDDSRFIIDLDGHFDFYAEKPEEFNVTFYAYNYKYLGDKQTVHFSVKEDDGKNKIIVTSIDKIYVSKNKPLNYPFNPISTNLEKITCTSSNTQLIFDSNCNLQYRALPKNDVSEIKTTLTFSDETGNQIKKQFSVVRTWSKKS